MCSDFFFFFKQKTAYEMSISDWSSDVCSSDVGAGGERLADEVVDVDVRIGDVLALAGHEVGEVHRKLQTRVGADQIGVVDVGVVERSEEHTSELQSLMRISYAVFCLKKKKQ